MGLKTALGDDPLLRPQAVLCEQLVLGETPLAPAVAVGEAAADEQRKRGQRGPNKDTEDMRRYLASLGYRPGQIALAELGAGGSLDDLLVRAKKLAKFIGGGWKGKAKALEIVFKAACEYAQYTGSKAVAQKDQALPAGVMIITAREDQVHVAANGEVTLMIGGPEENQGLIDVTPRESDADESDD